MDITRAVVDGHEICVHTWSHCYMTGFSNEGVFAELNYTMEAIKLVTGFTPTCWRPPFGDIDDRICCIAARLRLETIMWQYNSNDWQAGTGGVTAATVAANYNALIAGVGSGTFDGAGAIILTHELNNFMMQEAVSYYPKLAAAFDALLINATQHIVPIAVAQNKTQP
ncbi:hypothetical protein B0H10DRAFT_1840931 [Mycena sp. CBHHK59/15]|nr:hypothetical protein B0H10DRAFT_1840931 [Mycena sp. CBHHK59/15]